MAGWGRAAKKRKTRKKEMFCDFCAFSRPCLHWVHGKDRAAVQLAGFSFSKAGGGAEVNGFSIRAGGVAAGSTAVAHAR